MKRLLPLTMALIVLAMPAHADVIASCDLQNGYSYYFPLEHFDGRVEDGHWTDGSLESTTIFVGDGNVVTDVITSSDGLADEDETWTRSASDYGAPVYEVWREGDERVVIVLWGPHVEVYLLDMKAKIASLASQKTGLVTVTHAFVGSCE